MDDKTRADYREKLRKHEYRMTKARERAERQLKRNSQKPLSTPETVLKFLLGK